MKIDAASILEFQATLLSRHRFDEAVTALATELALKLGFDRVSVGLVEHGHASVRAISHSADVFPKNDAHRLIAAAMDEAIEQAAVLSSVEVAGSIPRITLAHKALARSTGNQVVTIPLANHSEIYGALTFERDATALLDTAGMEDCENIAALLGPVLLLKWMDEHPWYSRLKKDWKWRMRRSGFRHVLFRMFLYLVLIALVALLFFPVQYNVTAPAKLEGAIQRSLVAPENGFLQQSYVRPGDHVKEGQLLVELADQELLLEKRKWESELAQYQNEYGAALAQADRVQLVVNQSKAEEARSQLELAERKLERSKIVAPFDGIIIKGDLRQSLGAPVQRGDVLLTIAPANEYRLMIEVDEREVADVRVQQTGRLALVALTDKTLPFRVQRITPVATTKDGRNFFEVEATLADPLHKALRPGLDGVAKIDAGQRPFIWIWTHRMLNAIRMTVWSWGL